MTPRDAWLIVSGFVALICALTVFFECTEVGRRITDRAIDRITR